MYDIKLPHQNTTVQTSGGVTIAQACAAAGFPMDLVCGGRGTCGKCAVRMEQNGVCETVLACRTVVDGDMTVYLEDKQLTRDAAIVTDGLSAHRTQHRPAVTKRCMTKADLRPPHCGAYIASADPRFLRTFSKLMADPAVDRVTLVSYREQLLAAEPGDTTALIYGGAIDIGTTSVVLYAYDLNTGVLLHTVSALNGQIAKGADVISRILHTCQHENGLDELTDHIRATIDDLLNRVEQNIPGFRRHLYHLVLCGNSTMQHLFLGLHPHGLAQDPFVNICAGTIRCPGDAIGLDMPAGGIVDFLPLLGGFVGADTAAVLLTLPTDRDACLMVDLGTNGEIAVGKGDGYKVASTACGPALEGGNIACGMRGMAGAIERVSLQGDQLTYRVIGDVEPVGLCGSAIIDAVAELRRVGIIDETGRLLPAEAFLSAHPDSPLTEHLGEVGEFNTAFFLTRGDHPVYLSQQDVREIQLAKSSIFSGCMTLLEASDLSPDQVDTLYLSGAFGNYIDIDHALEIGLLPPVPRDRIVSIGNGAGQGVQMCLLDQNELDRCAALPATVEHVELATHPTFMTAYIMHMNF